MFVTARTPRKSVEYVAPAPAPETEEPKETEPVKPSEETIEEEGDNEQEDVQGMYTFEQLRSKAENPITGINTHKREVAYTMISLVHLITNLPCNLQWHWIGWLVDFQAYLSEEEFQTVFEMSKETFYRNPKWKQDILKKKADLF